MSTATARTIAARQRVDGQARNEGLLVSRPYRAPRPPEAELASSRGLAIAMLLVLPFWACMALITRLA